MQQGTAPGHEGSRSNASDSPPPLESHSSSTTESHSSRSRDKPSRHEPYALNKSATRRKDTPTELTARGHTAPLMPIVKRRRARRLLYVSPHATPLGTHTLWDPLPDECHNSEDTEDSSSRISKDNAPPQTTPAEAADGPIQREEWEKLQQIHLATASNSWVQQYNHELESAIKAWHGVFYSITREQLQAAPSLLEDDNATDYIHRLRTTIKANQRSSPKARQQWEHHCAVKSLPLKVQAHTVCSLQGYLASQRLLRHNHVQQEVTHTPRRTCPLQQNNRQDRTPAWATLPLPASQSFDEAPPAEACSLPSESISQVNIRLRARHQLEESEQSLIRDLVVGEPTDHTATAEASPTTPVTLCSEGQPHDEGRRQPVDPIARPLTSTVAELYTFDAQVDLDDVLEVLREQTSYLWASAYPGVEAQPDSVPPHFLAFGEHMQQLAYFYVTAVLEKEASATQSLWFTISSPRQEDEEPDLC